MIFTLIRRLHELSTTQAFASYSLDLQSIELRRHVSPLMVRLSREGAGAQAIAVAEEGHGVTELSQAIMKLVRELEA